MYLASSPDLTVTEMKVEPGDEACQNANVLEICNNHALCTKSIYCNGKSYNISQSLVVEDSIDSPVLHEQSCYEYRLTEVVHPEFKLQV